MFSSGTQGIILMSFLDVPLVFILVNEAMSGVFCLELQTILQFSQLQRRPYYLLLVGSSYYHFYISCVLTMMG